MRGKIYTLEELNSTLPLVRSIVRDIRREYAEIREALVAHGVRGTTPDLDAEEVLRDLPWDLRDRIDEVRQMVVELADLGVLLRDPQAGLVDAYGEMDGEIVFYSWRLGEHEVGFWRSLTSPAGERRPVHALAY